MKPSELLIAAKAVIADPKHFTVGTIARDINGNSTWTTSHDAICWCSVGAYYKAMESGGVDEELDSSTFAYLVRSAEFLGAIGVAHYSDNHSHLEVMAMWDKAIASAIADESKDQS